MRFDSCSIPLARGQPRESPIRLRCRKLSVPGFGAALADARRRLARTTHPPDRHRHPPRKRSRPGAALAPGPRVRTDRPVVVVEVGGPGAMVDNCPWSGSGSGRLSWNSGPTNASPRPSSCRSPAAATCGRPSPRSPRTAGRRARPAPHPARGLPAGRLSPRLTPGSRGLRPGGPLPEGRAAPAPTRERPGPTVASACSVVMHRMCCCRRTHPAARSRPPTRRAAWGYRRKVSSPVGGER